MNHIFLKDCLEVRGGLLVISRRREGKEVLSNYVEQIRLGVHISYVKGTL